MDIQNQRGEGEFELPLLENYLLVSTAKNFDERFGVSVLPASKLGYFDHNKSVLNAIDINPISLAF